MFCLFVLTVEIYIVLGQGECRGSDTAEKQAEYTGAHVQGYVVVLKSQHQHHGHRTASLQGNRKKRQEKTMQYS